MLFYDLTFDGLGRIFSVFSFGFFIVAAIAIPWHFYSILYQSHCFPSSATTTHNSTISNNNLTRCREKSEFISDTIDWLAKDLVSAFFQFWGYEIIFFLGWISSLDRLYRETRRLRRFLASCKQSLGRWNAEKSPGNEVADQEKQSLLSKSN